MVLAVIKDLQVAIKSFQAEYRRFPLCIAGSQNNDLTVDSANIRFLGSLLGDDLQDNPRGIKFIDLPIANNGRGGLIGAKGSFQLLDQWEHPYRIMLDANGDNQVQNPDRRSTDAKIKSEATEWLPIGVVVFSNGIDGVPHTGDDIPSWRALPPSPRPIVTMAKSMSMIGSILGIIGILGIAFSPKRPAVCSVTE